MIGKRKMKQKKIRYATKVQLDKVNKRFKNMSGFHKVMNGMRQQIDNCNINATLLNNEIKTLHKRIEKIEQRFRSVGEKDEKRKRH